MCFFVQLYFTATSVIFTDINIIIGYGLINRVPGGFYMQEREMKKVADSETELVHILFPKTLNQYNRLYGGQLMEWMDELAGVVARRHCGMNVVTAAVDSMDFKAGAYIGDTIYILGKMTYVGTTSMEIRLDTFVEDLKTGERTLTNTAYFVCVAVDENMRPTPVPGLELVTDEERAEWEAGERRTKMRKERNGR